jgi:L-ribulokinase
VSSKTTQHPHADEPVVIGIDFGTLSGRVVVVRASDGAELGSAVHEYRDGSIEREVPRVGLPLPPRWALQTPADYLEVLSVAIPAAITESGVDVHRVVGIATDFTASTMIPARSDGTPLHELPEYRERRHAYSKLWKHHAAQTQADRITELALERREPWLDRYGSHISSEWQFAKALEVLEEDPELYAEIDEWVEAADWITWQLTGTLVRGVGVAGYKGMFQDGTYPSTSFLSALHPDFGSFTADKLSGPMGELGTVAGHLSPEAAKLTGLPEGIVVAVGNVDAHVTAPAARATDSGHMVAIMGTSTCLVMNYDRLEAVPGMCGVVFGGIVPEMWGYEAGQSGVGDILAWFIGNQVPERYLAEARAAGVSIHQHLTDLGMAEPVGAHGLVALDWLSGNRSVLVDHTLSGVIVGLTLATRPEQIYRALLEATAFGTRTILETFAASGLPVLKFTAAGGLTKNAKLMQLYSDVLRMPISVVDSSQGPALGSAMHAAVAAGLYPDIHAASAAMSAPTIDAYEPREEFSARYDALYAEYSLLHEQFGRTAGGLLHRLAGIRAEAAAV